MATALLSIGLLVLFSIIGIMTFSFFDGERKGDLLFLAPAVGLSITTVLAVDCVALAPVRIMKYVVLGVFIVMLSVRGRKMLATAKNELKYKRFAIYAVAACVILCIPVLTQTGLVSITRTNNDLIYYLADMDWLTNHTFFEKPTFTDVTPYYFVTQNMYVHYSRLGFDVLGSVLMNLTGLQGNQLFFAYCVATVVSFNMMLLFFAERVLEIRNKWWWSLAAILTVSLNMWALLGFQYEPQIFGMLCMAGTVFGMILMWKERKLLWFLFTALMLAADFAVYSEFAYYLFIIFVVITVISFLYYRKEIKVAPMIYKSFGVGCLGLVLCAPASYKVVRYYLYLLDSANEGIDTLNADGWIVVRFREILSDLLGFSFSPDTNVPVSFGILGLIGSLMIWALIIAGIIRVVSKKKNYEMIALLGVCAFFAALELTFAFMGFDYGEFKHLISVQPFICILLIKCLMELEELFTEKGKAQLGWLGGYTVIVCVLLANVIQIMGCFPNDSYRVYTADLNKLDKLSEQFDDDLEILIPEEYICDTQHQIIYALKDDKVVVPGNSYFYKYTNHNKLDANAIIVDKEQSEIDEKWTAGKILYETDRFCIYELDFEKQFFENGDLKYTLGDEEYRKSDDCISMDDYVYCIAQSDGFKIYGPYAPLIKGTYSAVCDLQIVENTTSDKCVGFFEIFDADNDETLAKVKIYENDGNIEIPDFEVESACEHFEARVWLNKGVTAEISDIRITKR